ncbi:WD40 repeat protein [Teratosphaeria destructans]|uniref:WD40 repeat protein n=1 Tax=Teratosphaeria destructans TaxID=418781 RepID=A0A9W7SZI9_9PEZI|nr:WD40 repeat protein [Teratosphaeria destructans]
MTPEVIDLLSDSDSEEATGVTPNRAARTALQSFQPRKLKEAANGLPKVNTDSGLDEPSGISNRQTELSKEDAHLQGEERPHGRTHLIKLEGSEKVHAPSPALQRSPVADDGRSRRYKSFHAKESARRSSAGYGGAAARSAPKATCYQGGVASLPKSSSSRSGSAQGRVVHYGPGIAIVQDLTSSDDEEENGSEVTRFRQMHREDAETRPLKRQKTDSAAAASAVSAEERQPNSIASQSVRPQTTASSGARPVQSSSGEPFLPEHDRLLAQLREEDNLSWDQILPYFPGRTRASLQTRFCVKVKGKGLARAASQSKVHQTHTLTRPRPQPRHTPQTTLIVVDQHHPPGPPLQRPPEPEPEPQLPAEPRIAAQSQNGTAHPSTRETPLTQATPAAATPASGHGARFTPEEDALLARLKEVEDMSWREIAEYFPGRTEGALGVRYSTKIKNRGILPTAGALPALPPRPTAQSQAQTHLSQEEAQVQRPVRSRRTGGAAARDGFVSWSDIVKNKHFDIEPEEIPNTEPEISRERSAKQARQSLNKMLLTRQLGSAGRLGWHGTLKGRGVSDELKEQALDGYQPRRHYESTCGDVTSVTWALDGQRFAATSIAVSDDRSMQYNSGLNLVAGDAVEGYLQELPEHHVPRPLIDSKDNPNALHAMRGSQDPRLFLTVAAAAFSPYGQHLYSAGCDKKLRMYRSGANVINSQCRYEIDHPASVDLLSVSNGGLVATGCHNPAGSIRVFDCQPQKWSLMLCLSPSSAEFRSAPPLYPTSLKWGIAHHHRNFLLAGFSGDSNDDDIAGETALWSTETGQRWELGTPTRNVFDVAWNPAPSSTSTAFAVATTPSTSRSGRNTQSVVQFYAPSQNRARQVLEWDCPARDINDLVYCPHDDNLIAAGATDGRVYIWDQRFASRSQRPLHILSHGNSLNVLDHDRDRELADTGVRFLSWGATGSRLYTGSSDGVVKVWDPYSSSGNALVKDVATFQTAIMSGAFNHDFRDLLVGEESGRINLLSLGYNDEHNSARPSTKFKLHKAPPHKTEAPPFAAAQELLDTKQIIFRPMGSMPIRQAVQGPNYRGPYLKPSADDWNRVQDDLEEAATAQHEAHRRMDMDEDTDDPVAADARVKAAQDAWTRLHAQHDDADKLEKAAAETQKTFREAEARLKELEITYGRDKCTLGCGYLPRDDVDTDTRRSEQRIPGALQAFARVSSTNLQDMTCKDLFEAGLAGQCTHCTTESSSRMMRQHFQNMCRQRLASIKAGYKGTCARCPAPMREERGLCEGCSFACFRCSQPVKVLQNADSVQSMLLCELCELVWDRGVLGYELAREQSPEPVRGSKGVEALDLMRLESCISDDAEMEYQHSKWEQILNAVQQFHSDTSSVDSLNCMSMNSKYEHL